MNEIKTFTLDGTEYKIADLTVDQKYIFDQIADLSNQEYQLNFKLEQVKTAKVVFTANLKENLEEEEKIIPNLETVSKKPTNKKNNSKK